MGKGPSAAFGRSGRIMLDANANRGERGRTKMPDANAPYATVVKSVSRQAEGICSITLRKPKGGQLPAFTPGSHIVAHLPGQLARHYSLCGDPSIRKTYTIAVLLEPESRGGSVAMHGLAPGDTLTISGPKNNFPLGGKEARFHLLLAGGIGITPMMPMMIELSRRQANFRLHYCARSKEHAAFRDQITELAGERADFHFDGGDPSKGLNIPDLLKTYDPGTHLYYCGPPSFMKAVKESVAAWPPHTVHFEHFAAPAGSAHLPRKPFRLRLDALGETFDIPANQTIVEVLEENGIPVTTECREGYCGSCITRYLSGNPEHHDTVLSEEERKCFVMLCCARAEEGSLLTIDL
ncbi:MAG: PDR/VanB family oxidoreductase [Rhodomicrobium sp.]